MVGLSARSLSEESFEDIDYYQSSKGSSESGASTAVNKALVADPSFNVVHSDSTAHKDQKETAEPATAAGKKPVKMSAADLEELGQLLKYLHADFWEEPASKTTKRNIVKRHLYIFQHASICKKKNQRCSTPHCATMKEVIEHQKSCWQLTLCNYAHCDSSRIIQRHWSNCRHIDCWLCGSAVKGEAVIEKGSKLKMAESLKQLEMNVEAPFIRKETAEPETAAGKKSNEKPDALLEELLLEHVYVDPALSKATKENALRRLLEDFLHAKNCPINMYTEEGRCRYPNCTEMKEALEHQEGCTWLMECNYWHCASSLQVMSHWNECQKRKCWLCGPVVKNHKELIKEPKLKKSGSKKQLEKTVEMAKAEVEVAEKVVVETKNDDVKPALKADTDETKVSNVTEKEANRESFKGFIKELKTGCRKMRDAKEITLLMCIAHIILSFVLSPHRIVSCVSLLISIAGVYICKNLKTDNFMFSLLPLALDICAVTTTDPVAVKVLNMFWAVVMFVHVAFMWRSANYDEAILQKIKERLQSGKASKKKEDSGEIEAPKEGEVKDAPRTIRFPSSKLGVIFGTYYAEATVVQIVPEGAAEVGGELRRGDVITKVNGFATCGKPASKVIAKIRKIDGPVWLEVVNKIELKYIESASYNVDLFHI